MAAGQANLAARAPKRTRKETAPNRAAATPTVIPASRSQAENSSHIRFDVRQ
jgi:hypothetical protein